MKIRAERKELAEALQWVAQVIPKRPQMPALAGMRVAATEGQLTLSSFDYDSSHTAVVDVDVLTAGECLVSGVFLSQMVGAIKGDQVELVLEGGRLTITAGRSTYRAQTLRLEDYPTLPSFPAGAGWVDAADLALMVGTVQSPIDDESPFDQVKGLHLEGNSDELIAVGASRQALATVSASWECGAEFEATAPIRGVLSAIKGMTGRVAIGSEGGLLGFSSDSRTVTLRTFSDEYVKWRTLIREPENDAFSVEISADALLEAVKRASMVTDDDRLALFVREDELEISALSSQGSGEGMEVLEIECAGSAEMGMQARYLTSALAAVPSGDVRLGFIGSGSKPVLIRPLDHSRMTFIVMAMKVPGGAQ